MAKTVADLLVERLIAWGVDTIFGLPGDGINGVFEALREKQDKLKFIQVRHEESAAFAACGYAKFTGRLGVCVATSGPGGVHLLNGLYDAKFDRQPVLAITGHTFHDLIGTHYQQDLDLDKLFMDVSVYNQRVMGPAHVENVLDEAIKTALAYRGVAHLTIPKDIQEWKTSDEQRSEMNVRDHSANILAGRYPIPAETELEAAAHLVAAGSRIAILAGRGALGARDQVLQLAEHLKAPVIKALLGKAVIPDDSPFSLGGIGLLGTAPSQDAMQECDTLIMAGTSFPYIEFLPKPGQAKVIQIDIDPTRIGLRANVDVGLVGDCATVLDLLRKFVPRREDDKFLQTCQRRMRSWNELMVERGTRMDKPMKPQVVTHELSKLLDKDAIVISDSGTIATWAARYIEIHDEMQFSLSGMLATMANGLPYSIGASVAYPGRQVVCVVGDGGLTMLMGDIATLVKYKLPVKVIVIKNNELGQIKWEQIAMDANPEFGIDLEPIDFALHAQACGAAGFTIDDPRSARSVLQQALAHPGPAVIQAVVDPNEPPLPGNIKMEQAVHFAEALLRGDKNRGEIIKTLVENKVREVV
ncbi:MAG TPA: thiamine pyrophosphate-dependent enzyme [Bryobacteraceae bacterium]|jgi:pyruvate dehydrogenase (quinone)|nr:thiamine pyrophosphate-dependent enzyme [Bryobacteraceae bacterium]